MQLTVYLGIGSNIEPRLEYIKESLREIAAIPGVAIAGTSSIYATDPWGNTQQDEFLNLVVELTCELFAPELLHHLQTIEIKMGRQRDETWGPRNIDLDILLYGDEVICTEDLKVPHPYLRDRLFVLVPLAEINERIILPGDGASIGEVLVSALDREENATIRVRRVLPPILQGEG